MIKIGTKVMCSHTGVLDGYVGYLSSIESNEVYTYVIVKDKKDVGKSLDRLRVRYGLWTDDFYIFPLEQITEIKDTMSLNDYQVKSKRTLNQELTKEQTVSNMIMGILGETGEVADIIKKHYYQGHDMDIEHIKEEIGDVMFYIVNLCNVLDLDLEALLYQNHTKLMKRYPNGFNEKDSIERDTQGSDEE